MGVGVNVQKRVKVMHFIDIPRRPDEFEQRWGRGVRQGNTNNQVIAYNYIVQGVGANFGADAAQMGILESKIKSREQILKGDPTMRRVVEDDDKMLLFMMLGAHATGDRRFLRYNECKSELEVAQSTGNLLLQEINRLNANDGGGSIKGYQKRISKLHELVSKNAADVEIYQANHHLCVHEDTFACTVNGKDYFGSGTGQDIIMGPVIYNPPYYRHLTAKAVRKLVDIALQKAVEKIVIQNREQASGAKNFRSDEIQIGSFGGFPIMVRHTTASGSAHNDDIWLWLQGHTSRYTLNFHTSEQRLIRNLIDAYRQALLYCQMLEKQREEVKHELEKAKQQLAQKRAERQQILEKIDALQEEKRRLESELSIGADLDEE
jgi:hypothetical protein